MRRNVIETIMGAVVLGVAALFLGFAWSNADLRSVKGYSLLARFTSVGGLAVGSDVRINGIKVGTVTGQRLDPDTYVAVIEMSVAPKVRLPSDTAAVIASEGLLGGKYVRLDPGRATEMLPAGATIVETRDLKSVEEMVGELIFLATGGGGQAPGAPSESGLGGSPLLDLAPLPSARP
ncbi:MAG: outer membrane lipid asymmetry maintenance protein MlaD [Alphaproteobacteria bacterium]|nr:outer membrane lipid asymmetry maintenance protein MlaD [Alphaproteobacteria bacterium]